MTYDQWKSEPSPSVMFWEVDEELTQCELCELPATTQVDLDPYQNPGVYMVDLCEGCAAFERIRINAEYRNLK